MLTLGEFQSVLDSIDEAESIDEVTDILARNEDYIYSTVEFVKTEYLAPYSYDTYHIYAHLIDNTDYYYDDDITFSNRE